LTSRRQRQKLQWGGSEMDASFSGRRRIVHGWGVTDFVAAGSRALLSSERP
jgi:hypothetical protein